MCICMNSLVAGAQVKKSSQSKSYSSMTNASGKVTESATVERDGVQYKLELTDGKVTELYVDGKLIPGDQYGQYETIISQIKEQMRLDRIQAKKDQELALKDQQHAKIELEKAMQHQLSAKLDQERASKDMQQAKLDQERAVLQQEKAKLDHAEVSKNIVQLKLDQERAFQQQQQAKIDQERASKDMMQAKIDQERAVQDQTKAKRDQELAKLDQKQAEEDQRMVKSLISDLIKDGIVTDEKGIISVTLNATEMQVNGKQQPDSVFAKYKEKYSRLATGNFNYSNSGNSKSIQMHRNDK